MPVILARVDERLIHGQVALAWLKKYPVDMVIVVDDESANDQLKTMLLKMAVSGAVKCEVVTLENAKNLIEENISKRIFLCAKNPKIYGELLKSGIQIEDVNIGGMYAKDGREQYYNTIFLTDEEVESIIELENYQTKVEYRMVPNDNEVDIINELKNKG